MIRFGLVTCGLNVFFALGILTYLVVLSISLSQREFMRYGGMIGFGLGAGMLVQILALILFATESIRRGLGIPWLLTICGWVLSFVFFNIMLSNKLETKDPDLILYFMMLVAFGMQAFLLKRHCRQMEVYAYRSGNQSAIKTWESDMVKFWSPELIAHFLLLSWAATTTVYVIVWYFFIGKANPNDADAFVNFMLLFVLGLVCLAVACIFYLWVLGKLIFRF
jgi:hypothetical protein